MTVSIRASLTFGAVALAGVCAAFIHPDHPKHADPRERQWIGAPAKIDRADSVDCEPAPPSPASGGTPARAGPHPGRCMAEDNFEADEPDQHPVELVFESPEAGPVHP